MIGKNLFPTWGWQHFRQRISLLYLGASPCHAGLRHSVEVSLRHSCRDEGALIAQRRIGGWNLKYESQVGALTGRLLIFHVKLKELRAYHFHTPNKKTQKDKYFLGA